MIRINGFPLYQLGAAIGEITDRLSNIVSTRDDIVTKLAQGRPYIEFAARQSYLPVDSKGAANNLIAVADSITSNTHPDAPQLPPLTPLEQSNLLGALLNLYTMLARDLAWFDLYWIEPKLGYSTPELLTDASMIFPPTIRAALPAKIKDEVQQAANCLLYGASSAVGFHVLRAVELVVLDYFTVPGFERRDANNWIAYTKVLRAHGVHRKIVAMIDRLATLHRNELMHAEAVLLAEEAAVLFALMQEVLPIMIADVAKRKGTPIADFPILDDPRWQEAR